MGLRRAVRFLFTDIDDTLTFDGRLPASSLGSLERLKAAGLVVIPVTGRPAGWCDHIARMWPVDAVVGENGAFWFSYDRAARRMQSRYIRSEAARQADRERLDRLKTCILEQVPGAGIASDQFCRIADLAIDFREDVDPLSPSDVQKIVDLFEGEGATAKVSSIHVNGWFGQYDKLTMTRTCMAELFDLDLDAVNDQAVFVGDSPNDQPMFSFFRNSVGVANVLDYRLSAKPAWVTESRAADGFRELTDALLETRGP